MGLPITVNGMPALLVYTKTLEGEDAKRVQDNLYGQIADLSHHLPDVAQSVVSNAHMLRVSQGLDAFSAAMASWSAHVTHVGFEGVGYKN